MNVKRAFIYLKCLGKKVLGKCILLVVIIFLCHSLISDSRFFATIVLLKWSRNRDGGDVAYFILYYAFTLKIFFDNSNHRGKLDKNLFGYRGYTGDRLKADDDNYYY